MGAGPASRKSWSRRFQDRGRIARFLTPPTHVLATRSNRRTSATHSSFRERRLRSPRRHARIWKRANFCWDSGGSAISITTFATTLHRADSYPVSFVDVPPSGEASQRKETPMTHRNVSAKIAGLSSALGLGALALATGAAPALAQTIVDPNAPAPVYAPAAPAPAATSTYTY